MVMIDGKKIQGLLLIFAIGFLGIFFVAWPGASTGVMPGDLGDARFNAFVLEHFHQWITGRVHRFWDADFFYPFPWTMAFSVNHLGTGIIYSFFRRLGFDREDAFRWWYLTGYVANYAACSYVLSKWRLHPLAIAAGAFIFTFNLAVLSESNHAQLGYRFGIPLAMYFLYRIINNGALLDYLYCYFWFTWQFFADIYIGTFLAMLMVAFGAGVTIVNVPRRVRSGESFTAIFNQPVITSWKNAGAARKLIVITGILALSLAMAALFHPYLHVVKLYGFTRTWADVFRYLPSPLSYFFNFNSRFWNHPLASYILTHFQNLQPLFLGVSVYLLFALSIAGIARGWGAEYRKSLLFPMLLATLFLAVSTIEIFGVTPYKLIYWLPGMHAIRAVYRIILPLGFPVSVVCAFGADALMRLRFGTARATFRFIRLATLALAMSFLIFEAAFISQVSTTKESWLSRIDQMQAAISAMHLPAQPPPVIFIPLTDTEPDFVTELDAMMLSQDNGFPTINGYSGNWPPGYDLQKGVSGASSRILAYFNFYQPVSAATKNNEVINFAKRILVWNGNSFERLSWEKIPQPFAGPVPREAIADLKIKVTGMNLNDGRLDVTLTVENKSAFRFPSRSSTGNPLSFSWVYGQWGQPFTQDGLAWNARWTLQTDLEPHSVTIVKLRDLELPKIPGDYVLWLSMVQELVVWFHDAGMPPAQGGEIIRVAPGGSLTLLPARYPSEISIP